AFLFCVFERSQDRRLDPLIPVPQRSMAFCRQNGQQSLDQRHHAPGDLHAVGAAKANLVQRQSQEVVPVGKRHHHPQRSLLIAKTSDIQLTASQAKEQVLNLVQSLNRGGRIVDRRGKRLECNIHEKPEGVLRDLLEGSLITQLKALLQRPLAFLVQL